MKNTIDMPEKSQKRIVFTNENPNTQGSIVRNSTIDFSRFKINPVLLADHDWKDLPIGKMTDIRFENGNYSGIPVFHGITQKSKEYKELYEGGWLATASIGGEAVWRKDFSTGRFIKNENGQTIGELNEDGYMESAYFDLFEISLPTLPANPTAATEDALKQAGVMFSARIFNKEIDDTKDMMSNLEIKTRELVELSANLKNSETMAKKEEIAVVDETIEQAEKSEEVTATAATPERKANHVILSAKPKGLSGKVIDLVNAIFGLAHPEGEYGDMPMEKPGTAAEPVQPEPTGLEAEKLKAKPEKEEVETEKVTECKEAAVPEKEKEAEEMKAKKEETKKEETKMSAIPEKKTTEEVKSELTLAAEPAKKIVFGEVTSFTKLSQSEDGKKLLSRVFNGTPNEGKNIDDYKQLLLSIMNDVKYRPLIENVRFHITPNVESMLGMRQNLNLADRNNSRIGVTYGQIANRLQNGMVNGIDYKLGAKETTKTTLSTDSSFSSLDTVAVEWLPLIIFKLFPAESWKNEISLFSAQQTGRNLGVIWTNIAADPAIYRGTNPSPASSYSYTDTAVGVKLVPYWMQPMIWAPQYMHQLRYDQQGTGWAQGLAKLEAQVGDDLLYTFGAGALANSRILYTGGPIDNTQASTFKIGTGSNGVDQFYFNSAFEGELVKPGFNDILKIEQLFAYQNFNLTGEKVVNVVDSVTMSYIGQDKQTQSYLTRWVNENGADIQKIKHTLLHERSRVLAYDPAGGTVIDTHAAGAVIPATTQSANLAFVPSQLGIALGIVDVFFVQDPANYGFKMSMDMRIGGRALRSDYTGSTIYAFAPSSGTPS